MTKLIYPQGSWVAIVTPFDANLEMDLGVMRDLADFHAANGTSTLLIMGSTGEPTLLTIEERKRIIKEMAAYCKGKIHAFFGVTLGSTAMTIDLARYAQEQDADGIVIVVPPYIAPPQDAVFTYLKDVCLAVDISVGLYNNPARVIANVDPATIVRLFNEVPNLVADKEAMPSVGPTGCGLRRNRRPASRPLLRFSGLRPGHPHPGSGRQGNGQRHRQCSSPRRGLDVHPLELLGGRGELPPPVLWPAAAHGGRVRGHQPGGRQGHGPPAGLPGWPLPSTASRSSAQGVRGHEAGH